MAKTTELIIPTEFKIGELQVNRETLEQRIAEDTKDVITSTSDTFGYKNAVAKRAQYRTTRTTLAKMVKEIVAPHKEFIAGLNKASTDLGAIAFKGETYFDNLITTIDAEKERIKQEAILAEQRRVQGRINQLNQLGAKFEDNSYEFYYADMGLTAGQVADYSDGDFADFVADVQDAYNYVQAKLKADIAEKEAEAERQRLLAEKNAADALALKERITKIRVKELALLGFTKDSTTVYVHPDISIKVMTQQIENSVDEVWDTIVLQIEDFKAQINSVGLLQKFDVATEPMGLIEFVETKGIEHNPTDVEPLGEASDANPAYHSNQNETLKAVGFVEASLQFIDSMPFLDAVINKKLSLRIYPNEYVKEATEGLEPISHGKFQALNWITFNRH